MQDEIDYAKERQNLSTGNDTDWWKPTAGKHLVKFLSTGKEFMTEWEGKEINKVRYDIEVQGEKYSWAVTKGITEGSLYGQIVLVADNSGLLNNTITLVKKGEGKQSQYTVMEALNLMTPKTEKVKNKKPSRSMQGQVEDELEKTMKQIDKELQEAVPEP